jgi:hypothetical protein
VVENLRSIPAGLVDPLILSNGADQGGGETQSVEEAAPTNESAGDLPIAEEQVSDVDATAAVL